MPGVEYGAAALESRLTLCSELHRLGRSLRDARARPGVERPVFETIVRALAARFRQVDDLDSTHVWTAAVYWALAVDARAPVARSRGLAASDLNAPYDGAFDFSWVPRDSGTPRLLVAESEWGDRRSPKQNDDRVLKDLRKLVPAQAPYRVLVHSVHANTRASLELQLATEAAASDSPASFLFVSLEWERRDTVAGMRAWCLRDAGGHPVRAELPIPID